jgi:hypothetical protein
MPQISLVRTALFASALGVIPLISACAVDASDGASSTKDEERVATSSEALTYYENFYWDQYQGHVTVMWGSARGYCYLTGMGGLFAGTGENVHIELDNGTWVLNGSSYQNSVHATATCVSWADLGNAGSNWTNHWTASSWGGSGCSWPWACGSNAWTQTNYMGSGNDYSFCSLGWISGNFVGNTDVSSYLGPSSQWWVSAFEDGRDSSAYGEARCFGLGGVHYAPQAGTAWWSVGRGPVYLGQADQMMCALAEVKGNFRGGGESVQIQNLNGGWYLTGSSMQPNTAARAACVWLHER